MYEHWLCGGKFMDIGCADVSCEYGLCGGKCMDICCVEVSVWILVVWK